MRRIFFGLLPVVLLTARAAHAQENGPESLELAALENLLEQETEIVTRTRMNRDFVPGMVTVLQGETMQTLGARTVADALPYVPGVQSSLDPLGAPSAIVRGVAFPFNSGNIRIMIDGVPIARESAGQNFGSALLVPMTQVERLEFIRGPGSVVYGDFAFQGLLNIVTRKQGPSVSADVDSRDGYGGNASFDVDAGEWQASLNAAGKTTSNALIHERLKGEEDRHSLFANISRGGFSTQLSALGRNVDITKGMNTGTEETNVSIQSNYRWSHSDELTGNAKVRYLSTDFDSGVINSFKGDEWAAGVEYNWTGWDGQDWLFGAEYTESDVDRSTFIGSSGLPRSPDSPPSPWEPPLRGSAPPPGMPVPGLLSFSGEDRKVVSVYAQGQFELHPTLHLIAGARFDDVKFIGNRVTPRVSLVWQAADHHIFKAQYAEGFRGPTFFERAGSNGRDFDFEVIKTTELSYIYRRPGLVFRATAFDSEYEDMVFMDFVNRGGFGNFASAESRGMELELEQRFGTALTVEANASAVDSEDNRNLRAQTRASGAIPDWMSNLGVIWHVNHETDVAAHWNHVSDRASAAPRSGSMDQVDLTATFNDLLAKGLTLRFGVTNVFNDDAIYIVDGPVDSVLNYDTRVAWAGAEWSW